MRPRKSTRSGLLALLAAALISLSGCVWFANADRELAALREFALTLDGVTAVDEFSNGPTYTANPFSIDATGVALITIEGDDWQQTLPAAAHAVIEWLATEQTNELVTMSAGIQFPGGVIGLASTGNTTNGDNPASAEIPTTDARIALATSMLADPRLALVSVGWQPEAASNADAYVQVERDPAASVSAIVTEWMPQLTDFGPFRLSTQDDTILLESQPTPAYLSWIDAVDVMPGVVGWKADSDGVAVTVGPDASLSEIETALRGLDGFGEVAQLTLSQGELTIRSDGTVSPARQLAEALSGDDRFTEIVPGATELAVVAANEQAATELLTRAAEIEGAGEVSLTLEITGDRRITLRDVPVNNAEPWLTAFANIPTFDRIALWGDGNLAIDFEGRYTPDEAFPAIDSVRAIAIDEATSISIEFRETDYFFIARFDAKPQLETVDAGRDIPLTDEHRALISHWNNAT